MRSLLLVTTVNDLSIPLFLTEEIKSKIKVDFCFFHENLNLIKKKLESNQYHYIYIRDPFNYLYEADDLKQKINIILNNKKNSYLIDNIQSVEDIYFEDKWKQYQLFKEFMPDTKILSDIKDVNNASFFTKKRISSRAKGIIFDSKELVDKDPSDYVIQNKIKIDREYRVYVIFNQIIKKASLKNSKTKYSKVEIYGTEDLEHNISSFVEKIIQKNTLDFIGLDIAKSKNNLYLLEVNRSCLFNGLFRESKLNLAEYFVDQLLIN